MSAEEQAVHDMIDQIYDKYDVDKSGVLEKEEARKLVQEGMGNLGSGDEFSNEAFDEAWSTKVTDGSGCVEKRELGLFFWIGMLVGN